jgi:hypothetical protein
MLPSKLELSVSVTLLFNDFEIHTGIVHETIFPFIELLNRIRFHIEGARKL